VEEDLLEAALLGDDALQGAWDIFLDGAEIADIDAEQVRRCSALAQQKSASVRFSAGQCFGSCSGVLSLFNKIYDCLGLACFGKGSALRQSRSA
jgi:hypothetical protein